LQEAAVLDGQLHGCTLVQKAIDAFSDIKTMARMENHSGLLPLTTGTNL